MYGIRPYVVSANSFLVVCICIYVNNAENRAQSFKYQMIEVLWFISIENGKNISDYVSPDTNRCIRRQTSKDSVLNY